VITSWVFEGRCWKLGDDVPNDGGLMDFKMIKEQLEYDAAKLAPFTLNRMRPEFAAAARAGDVVVAGKRFAHGNPHIQGPLGLKGLGVALATESLQRNTYRLLVTAGVPFVPFAEGITSMVEDGDRVRLDVRTGRFANLTRDCTARFEPLPSFLLDVIEDGGARDHLRRKLVEQGRIPA
jgi:3-isopropylmalate/(R)-2-methylmalate dehydratase small subunit